MYIVFLSAFQAGVALHKNSKASGELAAQLVRLKHNPEVVTAMIAQDYGYEFEQSYAVRVETEFEAMKLAALAALYNQESVMVVDVLDCNRAFLISAGDVHHREPMGYLKPSDKAPHPKSYSRWRGRYWSIHNEALH